MIVIDQHRRRDARHDGLGVQHEHQPGQSCLRRGSELQLRIRHPGLTPGRDPYRVPRIPTYTSQLATRSRHSCAGTYRRPGNRPCPPPRARKQRLPAPPRPRTNSPWQESCAAPTYATRTPATWRCRQHRLPWPPVLPPPQHLHSSPGTRPGRNHPAAQPRSRPVIYGRPMSAGQGSGSTAPPAPATAHLRPDAAGSHPAAGHHLTLDPYPRTR